MVIINYVGDIDDGDESWTPVICGRANILSNTYLWR